MRILFLGNNDLAVACLKKILSLKEDVAGIVVNDGIPAHDFSLKTVTGLAKKENIPVYRPERINHPKFLERVRSLNPDLIVSVSYRQILKKEILKIPAQGIINLHPSYLPEYRGKNPLNWVLINGEKETGVTVHYIDGGIDTGAILMRKRIKISWTDTADSLQRKFVKTAPNLMARAIGLIRDGKTQPMPQNGKKASYYPTRTPEDGKIDWGQSAKDLYNLIRALVPPSYPGAFGYLRKGEKVIFKKANLPSAFNANGDRYQPGEIIDLKKGKILIQTGHGALQVSLSDIEIRPKCPLSELRKGMLFK